MQSYTRLFCVPIFSTTLALEPHSLRRSPVRQTQNRMDGSLTLRSHPACCLLARFFLPCFFLRAFFSLWTLCLRNMSDRRYGCAVIVCTGLLLRLLTVFLVFYYRSITTLLAHSHIYLHFLCRIDNNRWKRHSLDGSVMKPARVQAYDMSQAPPVTPGNAAQLETLHEPRANCRHSLQYFFVSSHADFSARYPTSRI